MAPKARKYFRELLSKAPLIDGVFRRFIWSRIHFGEMELRILNSLGRGAIDVAVDIGAAMGEYSWILNRISNTVYAFEPGKIHSQYLQRVTFFTNIHVVREAVGSTCGKVEMYTPGLDKNARHSATLSTENPVASTEGVLVEEVTITTLDHFFENKLDPKRRIDIVKIDVEGYEYEVLRGAVNVLRRYHPVIICEIEERHNLEYEEVFNFLEENGYKSYMYMNGEFIEMSDKKIENIQKEKDLSVRLGEDYKPEENMYINNFIFQHPLSCIKVVK